MHNAQAMEVAHARGNVEEALVHRNLRRREQQSCQQQDRATRQAATLQPAAKQAADWQLAAQNRNARSSAEYIHSSKSLWDICKHVGLNTDTTKQRVKRTMSIPAPGRRRKRRLLMACSREPRSAYSSSIHVSSSSCSSEDTTPQGMLEGFVRWGRHCRQRPGGAAPVQKRVHSCAFSETSLNAHMVCGDTMQSKEHAGRAGQSSRLAGSITRLESGTVMFPTCPRFSISSVGTSETGTLPPCSDPSGDPAPFSGSSPATSGSTSASPEAALSPIRTEQIL